MILLLLGSGICAAPAGAKARAGPSPIVVLQAVGDSAAANPDPAAAGQLPPDTIDAVLDPSAAALDSLGLEPDTLADEPFVPRNLSSRPDPVPAGWATGVWEWDREGLQSSRALTLLELIEEVPGVIPLRGGDFGQPQAATAFAAGAGRVRVFFGDTEIPPLDGGVVDLARTGIGGLDRVRVERRPGELRVHLFPFQFSDPRPYSFLEVGTGDLNTNLFRGVFAHPDAMGGNLMVALDRIDTRGPARSEPGTSAGVSVRHTLFRGEKLGLAWELRRMSSQRPEELWERQPGSLERTDWGVNTRYAWMPWLQAGLVLHRSGLSGDTGGERRGGAPQEEPLVNRQPRTQVGAHVSAVRESWWADGEYRRQGGPGWPSSTQSARAGGTLPVLGGLAVGLERQEWEKGQKTTNRHGRAWTRAIAGLSLFAEIEDGTLGVPFWVPPRMPADTTQGTPDLSGNQAGPAPQTPPDSVDIPTAAPVSVTERRAVRGGVEYRRGSLVLGAAYLTMRADSLHPLGLPPDRGGPVTPGLSLTGYEFSGSLPLDRLMTGLALRGSAQFWDEGVVWRYLPRRIYHGRLAYHRLFFEDQNLELWWDIGARGRDPMQVPSATPEPALLSVPFQQSWFGRIQVRISSVRLFILVENFTVRKENQDYLGRLQPRIRSTYGIRWTLWN